MTRQTKIRRGKSSRHLPKGAPVVRATPSSGVGALLQQAVGHHQAGRLTEAGAIYRDILDLDSKNYHALYFLGVIAAQTGQQAQAVDFLTRAIQLNPKAEDAHSNLGIVLKQQGKFEDAISAYRRAIELNPQHHDAHTNMGVALMGLERYEDAVAAHQRALDIDPNNAVAHNNLGIALHKLGRIDDALASYGRVLELDPGHVDAHWCHALALLSIGRYQEGWAEFQWRWRKPEFETKRANFKWPAPGSASLEGKRVLLHGEQGLGDEIFFLRFAPALKRGGAHVTYVTDAKIADIFSRLPFLDQVVTGAADTPDADFALSVGDLPLFTNMATISDIPPPCPLEPLEQCIAAVSRQLREAGPPPYIGITWRAGVSDDPPHWFKLAPLDAVASALKEIDGTYLALQRNPEDGEITQLADLMGRTVHDFSGFNEDLEAMLALLALIDDYVTVSNTNVHLRAGVGRTSRVLVTMPPEFRWLEAGDASPWFPDCRLYRQEKTGSWTTAFARLATDLANKHRNP